MHIQSKKVHNLLNASTFVDKSTGFGKNTYTE